MAETIRILSEEILYWAPTRPKKEEQNNRRMELQFSIIGLHQRGQEPKSSHLSHNIKQELAKMKVGNEMADMRQSMCNTDSWRMNQKNPLTRVNKKLMEDMQEKKMQFKAMRMILNLPGMSAKFRNAVLSSPSFPWLPGAMFGVSLPGGA